MEKKRVVRVGLIQMGRRDESHCCESLGGLGKSLPGVSENQENEPGGWGKMSEGEQGGRHGQRSNHRRF